ncbi:hypothetical protein K466DRAFT_194285 [Polyporus arcularius HHB13444]|uniref:Fungal-type protein kinase domain-containing protein n=1 Tax=Polyporus arcularius HHB13444 TaxID=1314778 RepID=A0A5C3PYA0_9APHY|nr:hypothetical protein K466DRAFT_194285 [Polyporus arcularius HHB13444]
MSSWDNTKDYQDGNLSTGVIEYLREVPVVALEDYFDSFCPPLPGSLDLDCIVQRLCQPLEHEAEAALDLSTSTPSWRWCRDPPNKQSLREPQVFQDISRAVTSACIELDGSLHPTSRLRRLGAEEVLKGDLQSSNKPDAIHIGADLGEYLSAEEERGRLWWDHAAVLYKFKKQDSDADALDDIAKMTWSLVQKLRADPACHFVRGCTVDVTGTRFWYADHSVMLVTEPIDFNKQYQVLASFFARLAFASLSQLGWDTSIERISSDGFRIRVSGQHYTTQRYLKNASAYKVFGRSVRVWEALDEAGQEVCIKDYWLDDDRPSESDILGSILAAISEHEWATEAEDPRAELSIEDRQDYFVQILASDVVQVDGPPGSIDTTGRMRNNFDFSRVQQQLSLADFESAPKKRSTQEGRKSSDAPKYTFREVTPPFRVASIASRAHHRAVMKRGKPLYDVKASSHVFTACADAAYALFLMRCVGWAHRDVSPGNILVFPTSEGGVRGVLADFEYSKHFDDNSPIHPTCAGTPNFIAVEVQKGDFLRRQRPPNVKKRKTAHVPEPPWTFCAAHDLESLWWILVWVLFRHYVRNAQHGLPHEEPPARSGSRHNLDAKTQLHLRVYDQLFSGPFAGHSYAGRSDFLRGIDAEFTVNALSRYWPEKLCEAVCEDLPSEIYNVYDTTEIARSTPPALYRNVMVACDEAAKLGGVLEEFPFVK